MPFLQPGQTMIAHGLVITAIKPMFVSRSDNGDIKLVRDSNRDGEIECMPICPITDIISVIKFKGESNDAAN